MKSRWFVFISLLALASMALSACAGTAPTSKMKTSVGQGEGEVDIISWAGYIERGDSDPAYNWVTDFEKQTGCKVNVKVAATSDEMVSLMNGGGYDLVTASGSGLDWKVSIVDLLKVLKIDSSLDARKELAVELGCPAELMGGDHSKMNIWLHKTVLQKIAENGGNIPKELLD